METDDTRKIILTCRCGQRMLAPVALIGREGLCPSCGERIRITEEGAPQPEKPPRRAGLFRKNVRRVITRNVTQDAKRRFDEAEDLYRASRYAEALRILDDLAKEHPASPDIESAREQCLRMMSQYSLPAGASARAPLDPTQLNIETVRQVVLEKLLRSPREEIQLQAADIALRILNAETPASPEEANPPDERADS